MITIILKDIDLDLPYIKNDENIQKLMEIHNMKEEEAIRYDYEQNWRDKRILFRDQGRCIASMYIYLLGKFQTDRTKKILINCVEQLNSTEGVTTTEDGFTEVSVKFELESFFKLPNYDKKRVILEKINEGVLKVAKEFSWDVQIFKHISDEIIDSDFVNEYVWKQKISPDKKFKAEVFCQHDIDLFTISIKIRNKKTNELIKYEQIIQDRPHELIFVSYLGDLKWISNTQAALVHKYKKTKWIVDAY